MFFKLIRTMICPIHIYISEIYDLCMGQIVLQTGSQNTSKISRTKSFFFFQTPMRRLRKNNFVIHVLSTYLDNNLSDLYISEISDLPIG